MTRRHTKIAISLPTTTLDDLERLRGERDLSRSALILEAIDEMLRRERERADVERYIKAYKEFPETEEDLFAGGEFWDQTLADSPWE